MGNEQSQFNGGGARAELPWGFQVLRNTNEKLAIEPWFDFVVGINGRQIDDGNPMLFQQEVRNCVGGAVTLGVWSAKGQRLRDILIPLPRNSSLQSLGLSLQWSPLLITTNIWHVLEVSPHSPTDLAGFLPGSDYILGSPDEGGVQGENGMANLVEHYLDRPLRLWVYNSEVDVVRELTITPRRGWGGEGAMGCVLGFGALHRLPLEGVVGPGGTLFDIGAQGGGGGEVGVGAYTAAAGYAPASTYTYSKYAPRPQQAVPPATPPGPAHPTGSQYITPALSAPGLINPARYSPAPPPLPPTPAGVARSTTSPTSPSAPGSPAPFRFPLPTNTPPPPTSPQIPTHGATHKPHKPRRHLPQVNMDEYMRESEQQSLELDRPGSGLGNRQGTPLPPPPRAGVPPPPRRGASAS
ncbi:hypothetical protein L211DRAFT_832933 [Terfezia boudieri ATCC MYA-4762]|uniref:PDZ GRASP-type domain-containing protein n=1 Tax=Terfezia boudieri ATCC MYA-4762 TaxID=1051890 RepID=A0A3N4M1Y5_9PEZI|nr:hypothetical protein L211DRAFT_832933 [Terfezia boudieri ATCC MYA-4762]